MANILALIFPVTLKLYPTCQKRRYKNTKTYPLDNKNVCFINFKFPKIIRKKGKIQYKCVLLKTGVRNKYNATMINVDLYKLTFFMVKTIEAADGTKIDIRAKNVNAPGFANTIPKF